MAEEAQLHEFGTACRCCNLHSHDQTKGIIFLLFSLGIVFCRNCSKRIEGPVSCRGINCHGSGANDLAQHLPEAIGQLNGKKECLSEISHQFHDQLHSLFGKHQQDSRSFGCLLMLCILNWKDLKNFVAAFTLLPEACF